MRGVSSILEINLLTITNTYIVVYQETIIIYLLLFYDDAMYSCFIIIIQNGNLMHNA